MISLNPNIVFYRENERESRLTKTALVYRVMTPISLRYIFRKSLLNFD